MNTFTVSTILSILVILACTTSSSVVQAGNREVPSATKNICTGEIQASCNKYLKTNNTEIGITLSKDINEYYCTKVGRERVGNEGGGTFSQCRAENDAPCKEFCTRVGTSRYTCDEYTNEFGCSCGKN